MAWRAYAAHEPKNNSVSPPPPLGATASLQVANLVCSPDSFGTDEDNWFGFMGLSNDEKEV